MKKLYRRSKKGINFTIKFDTPEAIAIGMLDNSLSLIPELIIILTKGTVKIRTNPAPKIVLNESLVAFEI